jgi:hypothetical protein
MAGVLTKPTANGLTCPHCGPTRVVSEWQTFADGSRHLRASCGRCRQFLRYLKQPWAAGESAPNPQYTLVPNDGTVNGKPVYPSSDFNNFFRPI